MANILITAPSLDENVNISGISSVTKAIIHGSRAQDYYHFTMGRKDREGRTIAWLWRQLLLIPRFVDSVRNQRIDIVHLNTDFTPASIVRDLTISFVAVRILNRKLLIHIHGGYLLMNPPKPGSLMRWCIRRMLRNATTVAVLSKIERQVILENYEVSSSVMPNAVKVSDYEVQKDFSRKISLMFIGRLVRTKGIFLIAQCMSELRPFFKDFDLKIYGVGPDEAELRRQLSKIPDLDYTLCGVVLGGEKVKAFENAHVFLLPSYGEGLPIAMLESMSYGCVPIVSDDASMATVIQDRHNGYVVRKGDAHSLTLALQNVFDNRAKLCELSEQAKETIVRSFNMDNYITSLNELYTLQQ